MLLEYIYPLHLEYFFSYVTMLLYLFLLFSPLCVPILGLIQDLSLLDLLL